MALSVDEINQILRGDSVKGALAKSSAETAQLDAQNSAMNNSMQQAAYGNAYNPANENYLGTEKIPLIGGILPSLVGDIRTIAQGGYNALGGTNPYQFISPQESQNIRGNNTGAADPGTVVRYGAGKVLEYAPMAIGIPGLQGAANAVGSGAAMGLGGGLQNTSNNDIGSLIGGAAMGGLAGGALFGAGKLAGDIGNKLRTKPTTVKAGVEPANFNGDLVDQNLGRIGENIGNIPKTELTANPNKFNSNMDLGPAQGPVSGTYPYGPLIGEPIPLEKGVAYQRNGMFSGNTAIRTENLGTEGIQARAPLRETSVIKVPETIAPVVAPKANVITKMRDWFQNQNAKAGGLSQPKTLLGESITKDQSKLLFKHINQMETANRGFSPNFENLVDSADTLRSTGVNELKAKGIGQANSFNEIDKLAPQVASASDGRIGTLEAKKLLREKMDNTFTTKEGSAISTMAPGDANANWQMDAGSWHDLAGETQGGFMKYDTQTSNQVNQIPKNTDVVDYVINKNAKEILKQSPSYKEGNDLFGALYSSLDKRTVLANSGNDIRLMYNAAVVPGAGLLNKAEQGVTAFGASVTNKMAGGAGNIAKAGASRTPFGSTKLGGGIVKGLNFLEKPMVQKLATYGAVKQITKPQTQMPSIGVDTTTGSATTSMATQQSSEQDFFAKLPFFTALGMTPKEAYTQYQKENPSSNTAKTASPLNIASAQSGLSQISKMKELLNQDSSILTQRGLLPVQIQSSNAKQFNRAATEASDIIARLRTGAAINDKEVELYNGYIPNIWDDPQTIQYKFGVLEGMFNSIMGGQSTQQQQQPQQSDTSLLQ